MKEAQLPTEQAPVAPTKSAKRSAPKGASALRKLRNRRRMGHNGGPTMMPRGPPTSVFRKHAYTLQELRDLGYGSLPFLYEEMADEQLIGTKLGRRTVVLAEHLDAWLATRPAVVSQYRRGW